MTKEEHATDKRPLDSKAKRALAEFLVEHTGCDIQEGADGLDYPCGTCVMDLLDRLGLDDSKPEYYERNKESGNRHNEVWRAILQIRDAR